MKIYAIIKSDDNSVVAISEEEKDVINYLMSKDFNSEEYFYSKIKGRTAERLAIDFEDLYLEHDEEIDLVMTRIEARIVRRVIDEEKFRIKTMISDLEHVLGNYKMSRKEKTVLLKALKIMESTKKTKRLKKVIDIDNFVGFLNRSKNIVDMLKDKIYQLASEMYIFINMGDDK